MLLVVYTEICITSFLQYDSLNYAEKSFDVDEGENIEIKYKWFMFVWDEVELEHKWSYILPNVLCD